MIATSRFGRRAASILAGAVVGLPALAAAQVMEIGADGAVTTFDGPMVVGPSGAAPLVRRRFPAARRAAAVTAADAAGLRDNAAAAAELSPALIDAVAWRESRFRPGAVSPAGAVGEMQLMPATARAMGVDPLDSRQNYLGGAAYLKSMMRRFDGNLVLALAAYNAGPGAVEKYGGVPPFKETKTYVGAILERLSAVAAGEGPAMSMGR